MADLHGQDIEEEEVWAMMKAREGSNSNPKIGKNLSTSSSSSAWRTSRAIPRFAAASGVHRSSSAPLNIPDWSKILKKKPAKKSNMWDDDDERDFDSLKIDGEEDYDDDEMLPPHEYLARRRLATTQIASFSMCEGIGRTLKGRDLTNLRKAILTKTGFLE